MAAVEPLSHLVLMSPDDFQRVQRGEKASGSWASAFVRRGGWTRLLARGSGGAIRHAAFDLPHFVLDRR